MSVSEYNYRMKNKVSNTTMYLGLSDLYLYQLDIQSIYELDYPGYKNGFSFTNLIPVTEYVSVSGSAGGSFAVARPIAGNISGFTQTDTWHNDVKIIATDGSNYAIGVCVCCDDAYVSYVNYYYCICMYSSFTSPNWMVQEMETTSCGQFEDASVAWNALPEYFYLIGHINNNPSNTYYPYPDQMGFIYWRQDETCHSSNTAMSNYIIPVFATAPATRTDINPDPDPDPIGGFDPYQPGGTTWTGGGTGTFDDSSDDIDIPSLPALSASSTGFITLFNPSAAQLRNLASYMWSGLFDIDTFRKLFADPMQCILGLSIVPVNVPSGGSASVRVGNIDTGISMTTASSQYVEVDCGSLTIDEYWGAYLDYDPYTEIQLYLPYIGIHALRVDDVMGKTITIKYHVDILSGACIAYVKCGSSVLYSFIGQCASSIPITGNDWTNVINGVMSIAGAVGSMVATGGASAPFALGAVASTAVNSMKPNVEKSGSLSGTGGLMGIQTPYIILTRPRQAIPERQNAFIGYPSSITLFLSECSGYTEVEQVHLEKIHATDAELAELETLLKSGVLL